MKIDDDLLESKVKFADLVCGDTFVYYEDDLLMKIVEIDSDTIQATAISLSSGQLMHISNLEYVKVVKAKIVRDI